MSVLSSFVDGKTTVDVEPEDTGQSQGDQHCNPGTGKCMLPGQLFAVSAPRIYRTTDVGNSKPDLHAVTALHVCSMSALQTSVGKEAKGGTHCFSFNMVHKQRLDLGPCLRGEDLLDALGLRRHSRAAEGVFPRHCCVLVLQFLVTVVMIVIRRCSWGS